jgi:hypothetical protein
MTTGRKCKAETLAFICALLFVVLPFGHADSHSYVGAKKCRPCHLKQYTSWSATKMAAAFDLLKPGVRADAKKKAKQDPTKDYTHDSSCLPCHTTGYGKPGGFKSIEETPDLAGVQCESCHGPHSNVLQVMTIQNKSYKRNEVLAAGLEIPGEKTCKDQCHNSKSPMVGANYVFDYAVRKAQGTHEHSPLKFPHN